MNKGTIAVLAVFFLSSHCFAHTPEMTEEQLLKQADVIDWELAMKRMKGLSPMGYHPFLMPIIMENRDFLDLTKEQVKGFMAWRNKNRVPLLHLMNKIVQERNLFHKLSLSPNTHEEVLLTKQQHIFKLHEKVLKLQLSCRREILDTFTESQWDNFQFVLTENGFELE